MLRALFDRRRDALQRSIERAGRWLDRGTHVSSQFSRWRMGIFLIGFVVCLCFYKAEWFHSGNGALAIFILIFLAVAHYHSRLEYRLKRLRLWQHIKRTHLARLRLDWDGLPPPKDAGCPSPNHPYRDDLDITGVYSLLRLFDSTISTNGHECLKEWLLNQNDNRLEGSSWADRQTLVKEIASLPSLRDRLALVARLIDERPLDGKRVTALVETPVDFPQLLPVVLLGSFLCAATLILVLWSMGWGAPSYWGFSFSGYVVLYLLTSGYTAPVFGRVLALRHELDQLVQIVKLLEKRPMNHFPHVQNACHPLISGESRLSKALKPLAWICHGLSVKAHPLIHVILNMILPWDLWLTYAFRHTCGHLRPLLPLWLERLAIFDAASALGGFACIYPHYAWLQI